jgi:DNA-binding IscR family transcriptional regulator
VQMELESNEAYARQTIAHALRTHPYEIWTRDALARRYGIAPSLAATVLAELVDTGIAERLDGPEEEYAAAGMDY